jgi:hypothetical protein
VGAHALLLLIVVEASAALRARERFSD